jgi:hypothetical protein
MLSGVEAFVGFFSTIDRLLISLPRMIRHATEAVIDVNGNGLANVLFMRRKHD